MNFLVIYDESLSHVASVPPITCHSTFVIIESNLILVVLLLSFLLRLTL